MTEGTAADSTAPVATARLGSAVLWRLAPAAVALGSLALGLAALGRRPLTTDEAASLAQADGPLREVAARIVHEDPGHAGMVLLLRLATTVGHDELVLRAPSAIAVAIAAGLSVLLGTLLLGRVAGLVTGVAFAANAGVVEASREVRPYALGLLGIVLATLLFTWALERGGAARWVLYALAAAALPLTHPLAASVLAAHGAALVALRDCRRARLAGIALVVGAVVAALMLAWMAADRHDTPDRAGTLDLERLGRGLAHGLGWNPVLAAAAVAGLAALFAAGSRAAGLWRGVLVAGLVAAPVVATVLAALALPVFPGALVLVAPGVALAAGAATRLLTQDRGLVWAGLAVLGIACAATIAVRLTAPVEEDWRALAAAVEQVRRERETVVVVPERARAVLAYYAPGVPVSRFARGEGAWVAVVADTPLDAVAAARPVVHTPRYALLRQFRYGEKLRLQHWVRP